MGKAVPVLGFLGIISLSWTLPLVVMPLGKGDMGGLALSVGSVSMRSWGQHTSGFQGVIRRHGLGSSISTSEPRKMELLTQHAQVSSHKWPSVTLLGGIWPFLVPGVVIPTDMRRDLAWGLITKHPKFPCRVYKLSRPEPHLLGPGGEVLGKEGCFAKWRCQRAVFELSISYSFVYFTCSLTV